MIIIYVAQKDSPSGPFLVSRYGAVECSKHDGKGRDFSFISEKGVYMFEQSEDGHGGRNSLRSV